MASEEAFLVGIQNGNERHFRKVKSLTQKVYADEHVVNAGSQVVHYLYAVKSGNVAMDIVGAYVVREQILRQLLSHTLRQRGDKHTLLMLLTYENLFQQVVNLILARTYVNDGVEESGGTDNLLYDNALSLIHLEVGWCGRHVHHLIGHLHKFLKP